MGVQRDDRDAADAKEKCGKTAHSILPLVVDDINRRLEPRIAAAG